MNSVGVRRADPGDEAAVRKVRLRALADAPGAFDSTLERESAWTSADWSEWLAVGATFLLEETGRPRGIARGVPHWTEPGIVFLMSMWVDPALRGTGAADALVAAVISWARAERASGVWLHVGIRNERARRCYERNGFRPTGREIVRGRDCPVEIEMRLEAGVG